MNVGVHQSAVTIVISQLNIAKCVESFQTVYMIWSREDRREQDRRSVSRRRNE